ECGAGAMCISLEQGAGGGVGGRLRRTQPARVKGRTEHEEGEMFDKGSEGERNEEERLSCRSG
ncbi:hypothetical protein, partial [Salmonella enterica]|uniref:hypothetical protein n=1 Tax=Salmonella enterica TaxID=28901 RepID=UPI00398C808C